MSFASGEVATLSLDGTDISEYCESVKLTRKGKDDRHRMLGSNGLVTLVQDPENTINVEGLIDSVPAALFTSNQGSAATSISFAYAPQGAGGPTRSGTCKVVDYDEDTSGEKAGMFSAVLAIDGVITDA